MPKRLLEAYMRRFLFCCLLILSACAGKDGATGPTGAAGATGPQGPQGPSGSNGTDNKIVATVNCAGQISGLSGAAGTALNGLYVYYNAGITRAGDVFANAKIADISLDVSGSSFYSAGQSGALTAPVLITADYATANGGWWQISVDRTTGITTAVYNDTSLGAQSPATITFTSSACSIQSW